MTTAAETRVEGPPGDVRMTFGEHLEELRWRLIKSVVALLVAIGAALAFYQPLVVFIVQPHFQVMKWLGVPQDEWGLLLAGYTAPIWAMMKLAFIVGFFVASPFIAYEIWKFVSVGLYPRERRYVAVYGPVSFALFAAGCVFGYLVLVPYGLYGMAEIMNIQVDARDVTKAQYLFADYLNLVMTLTIITGVIFELPLVMVFCTAIGLTDWRTWWRWIRYAIVAIFIAAAVLTPSPDVWTQLLMAIPLLLLYFLGMGLSALVQGPTKTSRA